MILKIMVIVMNTTEFSKLKMASRYWLLGMAEHDSSYRQTLRAFEFMLETHQGLRKDGVTLEAYHQLSIFSMIRAMYKLLDKPSLTLTVCLLHDTYEDYPDTHADLLRMFPEAYNEIVRVSKIREGKKISYDQYFSEMTYCPVTSIVKLVDRIHNLSTMQGVFSLEKEQKYVDEVNEYFIPMIKKSRRLFPSQESAYELIKCSMNLLVSSIQFRLNEVSGEPK